MATRHAGDFVYAQARLQARHADLLGPDVWAGLEQITDFGQFLQAMRATQLGPAVESFGSQSSVDEMEIALRTVFSARVEEAASWLPDEWQTAVRWLKTLTFIPFRRHFGMDRPSGPMADDHGLAEALQAGIPVSAGEWLERWRRLWPSSSPGLPQIGRRLVGAVLPAFGAGAPWPERRECLADRLTRAFRRNSFRPVAAFAHLGLVSLEFGRLRGNLIARRTGLIV